MNRIDTIIITICVKSFILCGYRGDSDGVILSILYIHVKEAMIKSIQDLSEHAKQKFDFCFAHKINDIASLILTAHPCTVGNSE